MNTDADEWPGSGSDVEASPSPWPRMTPWSEADQAELDVLVHALAFDYFEHRQSCDACQPCAEVEAWREHKAECLACRGDAPLTHGPPCERHRRLLQHNRRGCARCLPCQRLQAAIRETCDWREARMLLTKAEALRADHSERAA